MTDTAWARERIQRFLDALTQEYMKNTDDRFLLGKIQGLRMALTVLNVGDSTVPPELIV